MLPISPITAPADVAADPNAARLREAARDLEAAFLSEMLKTAKLGETSGTFGGGIGEDQFKSFLLDAQAKAMVEAGGIGLAEQLFKALAKDSDHGG